MKTFGDFFICDIFCRSFCCFSLIKKTYVTFDTKKHVIRDKTYIFIIDVFFKSSDVREHLSQK